MDAAARLLFRESLGVLVEGFRRWGAATVGVPHRDVHVVKLGTWDLLLK